MTRSGREAGVSWFRRAARAARDRARSSPLVVRRRLVYEFDLRGPVPEVEASLPLRFEIGPDPGHVPGAPDPNGGPELLFRAIAGGRDVYRMRIAFRREELLHLLKGCTVPGRPMFLYDCFTDPEFRGMGVYPSSLAHALRFGQERGFDGAYIRVERGNVPSVLGIERAGFKPAAVVVHAALFGVPIGPFGRAAKWPPRRGRGLA